MGRKAREGLQSVCLTLSVFDNIFAHSGSK